MIPRGVPPYISYTGMYPPPPPDLVGFLRRFGLETGTHFAHFGLESGIVFEGTTGVYKGMNVFIVSIPNE